MADDRERYERIRALAGRTGKRAVGKALHRAGDVVTLGFQRIVFKALRDTRQPPGWKSRDWEWCGIGRAG